MIRRMLLLLCLAAVASAAAADPPVAPSRFTITRVQVVDASLKTGVVARDALPGLIADGSLIPLEHPVLTEAHVAAYCRDQSRLLLTDVGGVRWNSLGGVRVPLEGIPVLISLDGEPDQLAMVWNLASSRHTQWATLGAMALDGAVHFRGPAIRPPANVRLARPDLRILELMRELGLLAHHCGGP